MQTTNHASAGLPPQAQSNDAMNDHPLDNNCLLRTGARFADCASRAASDVAAQVATSASTLIDEGKAALTQRVDAGRKWVDIATRGKPFRTLGIVAAIGIVVGLLIARHDADAK